MSATEISFPDVAYDSKNKQAFEELFEKDWSPFKGFSYAEILIFAMSYAFAKKMPRKPVTNSPQLPAKAFHEDMRNLMRSLAINETGDLQIIKKNHEVVKICQEYANSSILEIFNLIKNRPSEISGEQILDDIIREIESSRQKN